MDISRRKKDRQSRMPEIVILCVSAVIVSVIGGLSYLSAQSAAKASAQRNYTEGVINPDRELVSALKDAETGQRGYLLTGRDEYLEPYNQTLAVIPDLRKRLDELTRTTPEQHGIVAGIEPLVSEKLTELKLTIDLRRFGSGAAGDSLVGAAQRLAMDRESGR